MYAPMKPFVKVSRTNKNAGRRSVIFEAPYNDDEEILV